MSADRDFEIDAGTLRHSVELQQDIGATTNAAGEHLPNWVTQASRRCRQWTVSDNEEWVAQQAQGRAVKGFEFRYYAGLDESWQLKRGSRIFRIISVDNVDEMGVKQVVLAVEKTTGAP
jgi:head-tail adaptor